MSLSCSCDFDYDFEAGDKMYEPHHPDFKPFKALRRKRCCSCGELIEHRALCLEHPMLRYPYSDMEARFHGRCDLEDALCDEPTIRCASSFQCEHCGEIWLNLTSIGYDCLSPGEDMNDALKEYWDLTEFTPPEKSTI